MSKYDELNEFEAAIQYGFSPVLLRWFTQYSVVDSNKLEFSERDFIYYFSRKDLDAFDLKLRQKWPVPPKGNRPTLPEGIKREIKHEAHYRCPACNTNSGEVAHIKPVATSYCNHPDNLLYLCPTHHTVYDYGFRYDAISEDDVLAMKQYLTRFQKIQWKCHLSIINTNLGAMKVCKEIVDLLKKTPSAPEQDVLKEAFGIIIGNAAANNSVGKNKAPLSIDSDIDAEIEEITNSRKIHICPLCNGNGHTNVFDECPICGGNGDIANGTAEDLEPYFAVSCPLCECTGLFRDEICPECAGKKYMPRYRLDDFDASIYKMYPCLLCEGTGKHAGDDCPECNGTGEVTGYQRENFDASIYRMYPCPLCKGTGKHAGDDCPECNGDGEVTGYQRENFDASIYNMYPCPLCKGTGKHSGDDCPECHCDGEVTGFQRENFDASIYKMYPCLLCEGAGKHAGDDCPECNGDGEVTGYQRENFDASIYRMYPCPLCKGKGKQSGDDCFGCNGNGEVTGYQREQLLQQ